MFETNGDGYIDFLPSEYYEGILFSFSGVWFFPIFFFISGTDSEALEILFSDLDTNSIIDAKEF